MPLIILLVGGAIAWWASQRDTAEVAAVRQYVQEICLAAGSGEDVTSRLVVEHGSLRRPLARLIRIACAPIEGDANRLDVDVTTEATGAIDQRLPPHTARVRVKGELVLTLHLVIVNENVSITGYDQPPHPG
jgi:hypothetical protein